MCFNSAWKPCPTERGRITMKSLVSRRGCRNKLKCQIHFIRRRRIVFQIQPALPDGFAFENLKINLHCISAMQFLQLVQERTFCGRLRAIKRINCIYELIVKSASCAICSFGTVSCGDCEASRIGCVDLKFYHAKPRKQDAVEPMRLFFLPHDRRCQPFHPMFLQSKASLPRV